MSCNVTNLSKDEILNIFRNRGHLFDIQVNQTAETTLEYLDWTESNVEKPEEEGLYTIFGQEIAKRVSDLAKRHFESRVGKERASILNASNDSVISREAGTHMHAVLDKIVEALYNNKGTIQAAKAFAYSGKYSLSLEQFQRLENLAKHIISQVEEQQKKIDPEQRATVRTELTVVDPVKDRAGSIDVFVLFSDNSASIYDYKTMKVNPSHKHGDKIERDIVTHSKEQGYQLTMSEYRRILQERYGIRKIRHTRILPIGVEYVMKPRALRLENNTIVGSIKKVHTELQSEFLDPLPVAGEETEFAGLNTLLEKQYALYSSLQDKLDQKGLSYRQRTEILDRLTALSRSINKTIVRGEIGDLLIGVRKLTESVMERLGKSEDDPMYITNRELNDLVVELDVYTNLTAESSSFLLDLKQKGEEVFKKYKDSLYQISSNAQFVHHLLKTEMQKRALDEYVGEEYKTEQGNLAPTQPLSFIDRTFAQISEIDHPIFNAVWNLVSKKMNQTRKEIKDVHEDIADKTENLRKWAKQHGLSPMEAYKKIIDFKSGNLIHKYNREIWDKRNKAEKAGDVDTIKKMFQLNISKKDFEKEFKDDLEHFTTIIEQRHKEDKDKIRRERETFIKQRDLLNSDEAWVNKFNHKYLELKPEVGKANYSNEYKELLAPQNKAVLDFYTMFEDYNRQFRDMLNLRWSEVPDNFIANVRKNMMDNLIQSEGNVFKGFKGSMAELVDSFNTREEDVFIGSRDADGEVKRNIPVLFVNPFRDKDGRIDHTRKSYDLPRSLMLFANMAYNFKNMTEIEPDILALKSLLTDPSVEQAGELMKDQLGRPIPGKAKQFATKLGLTTSTAQLLEDFTDFYLYGIKFKESIAGNKNRVKALSKLKQYYSKQRLSFAVIPGGGAFVAGTLASILESRKNVSFTEKQGSEAFKSMGRDYGKYKGLSLFFDVYAENPIERYSSNLSTNLIQKALDTRNQFGFLRKTDETITDFVLNSMAYNFGINKEGKLLRLNRPDVTDEQRKEYTPINELVKVDKETGKISIDKLTEDSYLNFRQAVRSTVRNIIGSLAQDDISKVDTELLWNLMMHFKSWMPGVVRERMGKLRYDPYIQAFQYGRFKVLGSQFKWTKEERENGLKIANHVINHGLPTLLRTAFDLMTFGLAPKLGFSRVNKDRQKRLFYQWLMMNPQIAKGKNEQELFELYLQTVEGQLKAVLTEMRVLLGFLGLLTYMGGEADLDEEPRYMENWTTRNLFKVLTKGNSELSFMWNPNELLGFLSNPIPITGMLVLGYNTLKNTADEGRDVILGENSPYDKTPALYYTMQWAYGGTQLARILELYETYEKSPYWKQTAR